MSVQSPERSLLVFEDAEAVDLFGGPGGWDVTIRTFGIRTYGIESNHDTCLTRFAAGLPTVMGDVRKYGPANFPNAKGLIASPPCQTFTYGGKGAGRLAMDAVLALASLYAARRPVDMSGLSDERTGLVLEPLRWALEAIDAGQPYEWITLEQVPAVLPVWEAIGRVLEAEGYSVATGKLSAEQYGVPQQRLRAVLVARLNGPATLPTPTHSHYYSSDPSKLDPGLLPPVAQATVLGWGMTERPYLALAAGTAAGGTDPQMVGGSGARKALDAERVAGRWIEKAHPDGPDQWARPFEKQTVNIPPLNALPANRNDGGRLSINEAAVLQSFPGDYPWRGGKSSQYQQVGNAVPPRLAEAVLLCAARPEWVEQPTVIEAEEQLSMFDLFEGGAA